MSAPSLKEAPVAHAGRGSARIVAALVQLGGMQVAVALGTLVRNKAMAVYLRPEGFGEFTQLAAIASAFHVVVQSGMAVGLSRNAAAATTTRLRQRHLEAANLLTMLLAAASLAVLLPLLFSPAGASILPVLGIAPGASQKWMLAALLLIAPLEALRNNYISFLQGVLDIRGLSAGRSVAVAAGTLVAVPLIVFLGLAGACLQMAVASAILAFFLGRRCRQTGYRPLAFAWDPATVRLLASFGGASLLVGFSQNAIDTIIRGRLITAFGMAENGLYQAALAISTQVTTVLLGSIGAYALAAFSQSPDSASLQSRMDNLLRVVIPASTIGLGLVGLFSRPVFYSLYSAQFADATRFLPLLFAANHLQVASWAFGSVILAGGMIRHWIGVELTSVAIRFATVAVGIPFIGVYAIPAGLLLGVLFNVVAYAALSRSRTGVRAAASTWAGFALGGVAACAAAVVGASSPSLAAGAATLALLLLTTFALLWPDRLALRAWLQSRLAPGWRLW